MDLGFVGALAVALVVCAVCFVVYYAIGDFIERLGRHDPETLHRRARPLSEQDRPAFDPRKYGGDFGESPYGGEPND